MPTKSTSKEELSRELQGLTALARQSLGQQSAEQRARGEQRLVRLPVVPSRSWLVPALLSALIVLALGAGVFAYRRPAHAEALAYVVQSEDSAANVSLGSASTRTKFVRFSDGTELRLDPGAEAGLRSVSERGAAFTLSRGALHASVIHSATSDWRFDAGPFVVRVTGTAFALSWQPEQDRFDLRLEHGSVTVAGPVANEPIPVRGGQWLTIRPRAHEMTLRALDSTESSSAAAIDASAPEAGPTEEPALDGDPPSSRPNEAPQVAMPALDWPKLVTQGKAQRVVDEALARGLDRCFEELNPRDLSALADAARYTRHAPIARRALLAQRRRFARSRGAREAALLLGRLAESEHADSEALRWFDVYLEESPQGVHADEALGRKMELVRKRGDRAAARTLASEYLNRYPAGAYGPAARALIEQ